MPVDEGEDHLFLLNVVKAPSSDVLKGLTESAIQRGGQMVGSSFAVTSGFKERPVNQAV